MKLQRRVGKLRVEPAAVATGAIAFNLIVFFLVCASTQPDSGRRQDLPSSEKVKQEQKTENILIALSQSDKIVTVNGDQVKTPEFPALLARLLQGKAKPEDRIIVVRSDLLNETDGPMLRHGLPGLSGQRILTPRRATLQPNPEFLAERFQLFKEAG